MKIALRADASGFGRRGLRGRHRERGILLVDCVMYLALWMVVVSVAYATFYRCLSQTRGLARSAEEIARILTVGEKWREDVRRANGPIFLETAEDGEALHIPQKNGEVMYLYVQGSILRRADANAPWGKLLANIQSSRMRREPREHAAGWQWDAELKTGQRHARIRPLFSFEAVAPADFRR